MRDLRDIRGFAIFTCDNDGRIPTLHSIFLEACRPVQPDSDITAVIRDVINGRADETRDLLPLVYDELRKLAAQKLAHEKPGQTLQATALVHEAYVRLVGCTEMSWQGKMHFLAMAARTLRRVLVVDDSKMQLPFRRPIRLRMQVDVGPGS